MFILRLFDPEAKEEQQLTHHAHLKFYARSKSNFHGVKVA
jgi:hypothetical protein